MSSFGIIFWDDLRGFWKSKVMLALWIGMPLIAILMHVSMPSSEYFPTTYFTTFIISSIGGILGVVSLSVSMTNDINAKVFDLFLIRPVKRWHIIVSRFLAYFINILIACAISLGIGMIVDVIRFPDIDLSWYFKDAAKSVALSAVAVAICCSSGLLIGTLIKSVALSAIISVYLGQQLSSLIQLPMLFVLFDWDPDAILGFSVGVGLLLALILLLLEILAFNRKQF
ncbi:MAG: ABC transporter permease [Candidatus Heimdallarchaeota archaeon]